MPTKIAIVHDWLNGMRGGERVLEALCEVLPKAEIFTLFHVPGSVSREIEKHPIHTSFIQKIPGHRKIYRHLLPILPLAIESLDLSGFDLVISTSHCVAKGVLVPPSAYHLSYCFSPMRYIWDRSQDYFSPMKAALLSPTLHYLRIWDTTSSQRVDEFVGISNWIARRIERCYGRKATVIYPPADTEFFRPLPGHERGDHYLVVSAFAPYKRIDLAIRACRTLGRKLVIVGAGQQQKELEKIADSETTFLGKISDPELCEIYQGARALLFPGEEDYGIVPVEAMACGLPVIAFNRGGAFETVVHRETGVLFGEQTEVALVEAMREFEALVISRDACRARAELFSKNLFQQRFLERIHKRFDDLRFSSRPRNLSF